MATHVARPEILHDLQVTHTVNHPVFVLGCGRSGTSLFGALLRKYTKVNFGPETQFIVDIYRRLDTYGDLQRDANFRLLIADIARERCFERWQHRFGFQLDASRVAAEARERTYAGVLTAIFEQFAAHHGMVRWGEKSPNYDRDLGVILELFPQARFIHIVRDGRDVALSTFKCFFGAKNAYKAALDWRREVSWVQQFQAVLPPHQFMEVRYEDLLRQPRATFARIIEFLRISDPDGQLLDFIAERIKEDLRPETAGKWSREFTPGDCSVFEGVAGDMLRSFGYPVTASEPAPPRLLARAYYHCDNKVRKWLNWEYQLDNVYKIRLRLRQYSQPLRRALTFTYSPLDSSRKHGAR
jgi:hypothetical protein